MEAKKSYCIRPIPLCRIVRDKSQWTYRVNYGQKVDSGVYVWYIENSEPKILIDAGIQAEQYADHGLSAEHVQTLEQGLERVGIRIEDIDIVILTHLHFDHIALAPRFEKTKFVIQKQELDFALNPHPMVASSYNHAAIRNFDFDVVDGDKEIIEGVNVILTPGHTPGTQSVAVRLPTNLAVIAGFCCIGDNFAPSPAMKAKGLEVVAPGINLNALQAYDSVLKVKKVADVIVPLHDICFMDKDRIS